MRDSTNRLSRSYRTMAVLALALVLALLLAMVDWRTGSGYAEQADPETPTMTEQSVSASATLMPTPTAELPVSPTAAAGVSVPTMGPSHAFFLPPTPTSQPAQPTVVTTTATAVPLVSPTATAGASVPAVDPPDDLSLPPTPKPHPIQPAVVTPTPASHTPISETVVPGTAGAIALTFDCGFGAASLDQILATLADADVRATFFLEGNWVERSPQIVAPIVAAGHVIGNHSYSHPNFAARTESQVVYELTRTAALVADAGGPASLSLFRYPYGSRSRETDAWVTAQGYTIVGWSIDPQGWRQGTTSEQVLAAVLRNAKPGGIVLMHCGSVGDQGALAQVITSLRARGYALVTVLEVLGATGPSVE